MRKAIAVVALVVAGCATHHAAAQPHPTDQGPGNYYRTLVESVYVPGAHKDNACHPRDLAELMQAQLAPCDK